MTEQNSKPAQPCARCHGSGRVGYVMADGRRGKYCCPDCGGKTLERKAYVEGTMRNQKTVSLKEASGEVKRLLQPPTTPDPPSERSCAR